MEARELKFVTVVVYCSMVLLLLTDYYEFGLMTFWWLLTFISGVIDSDFWFQSRMEVRSAILSNAKLLLRTLDFSLVVFCSIHVHPCEFIQIAWSCTRYCNETWTRPVERFVHCVGFVKQLQQRWKTLICAFSIPRKLTFFLIYFIFTIKNVF